jgi:hypothetical protein
MRSILAGAFCGALLLVSNAAIAEERVSTMTTIDQGAAAAVTAAGARDDGWNDRFVAALTAEGLKLVPTLDRGTNLGFMAPKPLPIGTPFLYPSMIVKADDFH